MRCMLILTGPLACHRWSRYSGGEQYPTARDPRPRPHQQLAAIIARLTSLQSAIPVQLDKFWCDDAEDLEGSLTGSFT